MESSIQKYVNRDVSSTKHFQQLKQELKNNVIISGCNKKHSLHLILLPTLARTTLCLFSKYESVQSLRHEKTSNV